METTPAGILNNPVFFAFFFCLIAGLVFIGGLFLIRAIVKNRDRENKAFDRTLIQVLVPKERKSEGQGGQISQEDRWEQVKEEIALTETFFASIAGLRAQSGFKNWLKGRTDHFSFEIVASHKLISFYAVAPAAMSRYLEQQIQAFYPEAELEESADYNIFSPRGQTAAGFLKTRRDFIFPLKMPSLKALIKDPASFLSIKIFHPFESFLKNI